MTLDAVDRRILKLLQEDARSKVSTIAREIHLSVTATVRRIERMEDAGVIRGYRTLIAPEAVELKIHGFIVGGVYRVMLDQLQRYVRTVPEIVRCETIISGGKEVILEFYCRDTDALMTLYNSSLRSYLDSMVVYLVKSELELDTGLPLSD